MNHKPTCTFSIVSILSVVFSLLSIATTSVGAPTAHAAPLAAPLTNALQFNGTSQYVTFGRSEGTDTGLGVQVFTIETWFKKTGTGVTTSTGTGGITAIPLVTKGRGEGDNSNVDMNYFFGIDSTGVLAADFEECARAQTGCPATTSNASQGGQNYPVKGTTAIQNNIWYHAAVTFDGRYWKIYLNGVLETMTAGADTGASRYPRWDSIQHAGIGTAMTSTGAAAGFFQGIVDEVRIWNVVRTQAEIQASMNSELTSGTGLIGRWGLNEGTGITAANSIAGRPNIINNLMPNATPPTWVIADITPPTAPTDLTATPYSGGVNLTWTAPADLDLAGYNIYRSTFPSVPLTSPINGDTLVSGTNYTDGGLTNGTPYYYVVTAVDTSTNQSIASNEVSATPLASLGAGLSFDGTNDYVTFGTGNALAFPTYTVETWFKRTGAGVGVTTGTGGIASAIPLVTKGTSEGEVANIDINYFLGIDANSGVLIADFEEGAGGTSPSLNHPVSGATAIANNTWYHAAMTYDGTTLKIYLNGNQEGTLTVGQPTASATTSPTAFGASIRSNGTTIQGYFAGVLDEVRIWNVARTQAEIMATINSEVTSGSGLVARWGMNEGTGTSIASSVGTFLGTLTNGPTWVAGAPFNIAPPTVPAAPTLLSATPTAGLEIDLAWTDNSDNETSFKVERSPDGTTGWTQVGTTAADAVTYGDAGLDPATQYCYHVRASNIAGDSDYSNTSCATTPGEPNNGLNFGSSNAYATFGNPPSLGLTQFTIETWFKRTGTGVPITTGTGGIPHAIPLVTKGTSDVDNANNRDFNYFLGIDNDNGVLIADFEEGAGGASPSQNHPVSGTTPIAMNTWYHAVATYDGTTWNLYLNGNLEATLTVGQPPRSDNTSPVAMATSIKNDGTTLTPQGYFDGTLDEVRIWNYARTQTAIQGTMNSAITSPQTGLVARWGLNETSGTSVSSNAGTSVPGTISGTGYSWGAGAPAIVNHAPALISATPADLATDVSTSPTLSVDVSDVDLDNLTVKFYGRPKAPDFAIIALPDTQNYSMSYPAIFTGQTDWIVNNRTSRNIAFVTHLGDTVNNADVPSQWTNAVAAMNILDAAGIPYGMAVGNHDQNPYDTAGATTEFNTYFGVSHFDGRAYYGGHYGTKNDNSYQLFSAGGMDFIVVHLESNISMDPAVVTWADGLLQTYSTRRAIVVTHNLLNGTTPTGQANAIFDGIKTRPNLFLMLGGHLDTAGRTYLTGTNGNRVDLLRSDYQNSNSQQSGYLRIMTFMPQSSQIQVETYSPNRNDNLTDSANQFTLAYPMSGSAFQQIGTDQTVLMGNGTASVTWAGLDPTKDYEWYVTINDAVKTTTPPTWSFTTVAAGNQAPVITEGASTGVTMSEDGAPIAFNLTLHATDADAGDTLTWSVTTPASNGIASASGTGTSKDIAYTPVANYNGSDGFVVQVSDGNGGVDAITVNVTIQSVNDPPVVTNPGTQTTAEGATVSLQIVATDADIPAQTLSYGATSLPEGLTINTTTGLISGVTTYHAAANSPYNTTVTVTDGVTPTQQSFTWNVTQSASGLCGNDAALVACWPMEEGSGSLVIDATAFGNDGTITGSPTWVTGKTGLALDLSGSGQYAMVPDSDSLDIATNRITLAGWVKPEKTATQNIIKKTTGTTVANGYELSLSSAGKVFMRLNGNAAYRIDSITSYPIDGNTWMHVAATYDGTNLRIYINGVLDNTKAAALTIAPNTTSLGIGAEPTIINLFQGLLDDVRVYNRDLSLAEIQALAGVTPPTCYWLTLNHTGEGSDPVASPASSTGCAASQYVAGASINLSGAVPVTGWQIGSWTGTNNDLSTVNTNTVTMPAGDHTAGVNYIQSEYTLTVVSAHGTVTKSPDQATYHYGDVVTLTATADAGWTFSGWMPPLTGNRVTIAGNTTVTANYTQNGYIISGNAGVAGATLSYTGGSTIADSSGSYSLTVLSGWSGTVTPSMAGYTFTPTGRTYTNVLADQVGQDYTATPVTPPPSGLTCTILTPKPATASTGEKPQSKVWSYAGNWYAVFPTNSSGASSAGTWLWKLEGTTWTEVLKLSDRTDTKADVKVAGTLVHVLLYADSNTQFVSAEYAGGTYQLWTSRPTAVNISLPGSEIATIDMDSTGKMWLATRNNNNTGEIVVYHSDSPYNTWNGPIVLATGVVANDDIAVVTALPNGTVGVLWANETTRLFGFRVHVDGADPTIWSADELPASQSAQNVGLGMADDHLNVAVASDSTLYAAVKTSYDTAGYPRMALLVRRPNGTWDDLYGIDETGTRPIVLLDEVDGYLTYIYTSSEGYNPIVYRQSTTQNISFTGRTTLRTGSFNDVSSMKANYTSAFVVLYSSATEVAGQLCVPTPTSGADLSITKTDGVVAVRPNITVTYLITATNNGPQVATGATVVDILPLSLINASWTCSASGGASCPASGTGDLNASVNLPVGGSVTFNVSARVDLGARGTLTNVATITAPPGVSDPISSNNSATDTDTIVAGGASCEADPTLVGCWQMEENGGPALVDGSSYLNDGALNGNPAWSVGKVGSYALDLNGTSQYALVPTHATLDLTNQMAIAAWIRPEQYATQDIVKKATNGGINGYELSLATTKTDASSRKVFFRINQVTNGDTYRINSTTEYPINGDWMHVAATFDGTTMRLYINGVLESSLAVPAGTTIATNTLPVGIGAQSDGTRWFMGWMDEARIYNRALSLDEIQALAGVAPLTVSKTGTGSGTVTSNPAGIDCGIVCSFNFPRNASVILTAASDLGSTFTGWSGAGCSGTGTCTVTMDAAKSVTATYSQNEYTLTVVSAHGTVTKSPDQATYHYGDVVTLTATADAGWTFTGWTPPLTGNRVTIAGNTTVTATYSQNEYTLTVVSAHGTVTKSPDQATYHYGDVVTLTATADAGWTFTGWTPPLTGNRVTIAGNTTVTATYSQNEYTLTVVSAHGTVTKSPDQATYHYGDVVTLTATADAGWTFTGWTPPLTGNRVTIVGNTTVTANYTVNDAPAIQVIKEANVELAGVGDVITYTYRVQNIGNVLLTNVSASDDRLGAIGLYSTTLLPGEVTTGVATYTVVRDDLPGPITNTVIITGISPAETQVNGTDTITVGLKPAPEETGTIIYLPIITKNTTRR